MVSNSEAARLRQKKKDPDVLKQQMSELSKKRWSKLTQEERSAHMRMMVLTRFNKKNNNA